MKIGRLILLLSIGMMVGPFFLPDNQFASVMLGISGVLGFLVGMTVAVCEEIE